MLRSMSADACFCEKEENNELKFLLTIKFKNRKV